MKNGVYLVHCKEDIDVVSQAYKDGMEATKTNCNHFWIVLEYKAHFTEREALINEQRYKATQWKCGNCGQERNESILQELKGIKENV